MSERTCTVDGCEKRLQAKGLCAMHYKRVSKTGTLYRYGVTPDPYANTTLKTCRECGEAKERGEFTRNQDAADGLKGRCKPCDNAIFRRKYAENHNGMREAILARSRKYLYGLDADEIEDLLDLQDGKCALCSVELDNDLRKFHVDHCHATGQPRGLLCPACNRAIGFFNDDIESLKRAIRYLENPPMRRMARKKAQ